METNRHGGNVYSFKDEKGRFPLDFSANVNPLGLPAAVKKKIRESLNEFTLYPDIDCNELCEAIARFESTRRENILCGNGAGDLIFRLAYALKPKKALLISPTFTEYEAALRNVGCELYFYDLHSSDQFVIHEDILEMIPGMDIVFICNPNNPTGQLTPKSLLIKIAEACSGSDCVFVMDECFIDFIENREEFTMKNEIARFGNLVVLKAFTKIFAFAGIRLGYCLCSDHGLLRKIFAAGQPWSVSVVAQLSGIEALKDTDYLVRTHKNTSVERRFLKTNLEKLGFEVFDSYANFLMFHIKDESSQESIYDRLLDKEILIRKCGNFRGLDSGYYRIAVKSRKDNIRLVRALSDLYDHK
ncbi:MAG: pyridoxal phosphate-dependent aminotransferase [Saccharofermentanales bacterium]